VQTEDTFGLQLVADCGGGFVVEGELGAVYRDVVVDWVGVLDSRLAHLA
jgi:hypothetical protein